MQMEYHFTEQSSLNSEISCQLALRAFEKVTGSQTLHQVQPREQVGAQTGAQYEFQYHQAAAEALSLLEGLGVGCVYCEWPTTT